MIDHIGDAEHVMIQPASVRLNCRAVRNNVGVHTADAQKTEPPRNSASARMRMGNDSASRNEPERAMARLGCASRIQKSCNSKSTAAMTPTVKNAMRQPNVAVTTAREHGADGATDAIGYRHETGAEAAPMRPVRMAPIPFN